MYNFPLRFKLNRSFIASDPTIIPFYTTATKAQKIICRQQETRFSPDKEK